MHTGEGAGSKPADMGETVTSKAVAVADRMLTIGRTLVESADDMARLMIIHSNMTATKSVKCLHAR